MHSTHIVRCFISGLDMTYGVWEEIETMYTILDNSLEPSQHLTGQELVPCGLEKTGEALWHE